MQIEVRYTIAQLLAYAETWTATRRYIAEHGREVIDETAEALAGPRYSPALAPAISTKLPPAPSAFRTVTQSDGPACSA